jgi:hypothetical protein
MLRPRSRDRALASNSTTRAHGHARTCSHPYSPPDAERQSRAHAAHAWVELPKTGVFVEARQRLRAHRALALAATAVCLLHAAECSLVQGTSLASA